MNKQRVVHVSTKQPSYAVCVLGTEISLDIKSSMPRGATSFEARGTGGLQVYVTYDPRLLPKPEGSKRWPLDADTEVIVSLKALSSAVNDNKVRVSYYDRTRHTPIAEAWVYITCIGPRSTPLKNVSILQRDIVDSGFILALSLDADSRRTGTVQSYATNKTKWTWGPDGEGAVLLVNCDRDGPSYGNVDHAYPYVRSHADLQDLSLVILNINSPTGIFYNHKLILHISMFDAAKVRVFHAAENTSVSHYENILGSDKLSYTVQPTDGRGQHTFYVEGLAFPDGDFNGLVSLNATLLEQTSSTSPATPVFTDMVVFHVAPWLMTPNTQRPLEIFVCSIEQGIHSNGKFLEAIKLLARKANCKLTICPEVENRGDRWIQDEMEFGYVDAPHQSFPVVFDSPRNRGLKEFPFKKILGPDFGYVTREPKNGRVSSLDSFGNLDVSPPVSVKGRNYSLGRILIGSSFPGSGNRKMTKIVRDFLYAQKVQAPVELYSDWLTVGHVDEFLSFVPAPGKKGFRLLLASPLACLKLFEEKQREGYGKAALFEGLRRVGKITLDEILMDRNLRQDSKYVQSCIDWNRSILKRELGLTERDIVDIPQLFTLEGSTATALFPDMVNMLVLGEHLGIPKPYGPIIHGQCCLEVKVRSLLEPLGLSCMFIDDFFSYHVLSGEVHCGTNVLREPFSFRWWNMLL
ncbi:protein-arginine deiminase type-1-like [Ahaetulla prasina]|uniref:protein-arginine deiminase type-1-like n=1 Tax=Ahaetulla prasina TaxID=499056 RepID=UPI0026498FB2|nr:protein-arginine deiminase type-1-like [Ahaetulla prasina]